MPELPEVELVSRSLNTLVTGKRISSAILLRERLAPETTPADFAERLSGGDVRLDLVEGGDHRLSTPRHLARLVEAVEGLRRL